MNLLTNKEKRIVTRLKLILTGKKLEETGKMGGGIEKLTEDHKQQLIRHINKNRGDSYGVHAVWATNNFNVNITAEECFMLWAESEKAKRLDIEKSGGNVVSGMEDKLTPREKSVLVSHMRKHEDDTWTQHALWFLTIFDKTISAQECSDLYMETIYLEE